MNRTPEGSTTMLKLKEYRIASLASRFVRDENGATAIEYAIIASGVGVAIAATVVNLGSSVKGLFTNVSTSLK
jgi:pilus assembly protein Flp/PilA